MTIKSGQKRFLITLNEETIKTAKERMKDYHLQSSALGSYFNEAAEMIPDLIDMGINPVLWMRKQKERLFVSPQGQLELWEKDAIESKENIEE